MLNTYEETAITYEVMAVATVMQAFISAVPPAAAVIKAVVSGIMWLLPCGCSIVPLRIQQILFTHFFVLRQSGLPTGSYFCLGGAVDNLLAKQA